VELVDLNGIYITLNIYKLWLSFV